MRRFFIGDLHGCADELDELLERFGFVPGTDQLFSVGDIVGKGPKCREALARVRDLGARVVLGNHDAHCLDAAALSEDQRTESQRRYLTMLGEDAEREAWLAYIASWPWYREEPDLILVHGGLEPGVSRLADMPRRVLLNIRTWDGRGADLKSEANPPWFECVSPGKTVVFGHWAKRGLIDLPGFKGLDTGCVYGRMLTGWCPEENRFYQVRAHKAYAVILGKHGDD
jgi:bis(5'-nucleosyl)-tetraphosphatase (symmetrical)